MLTFGSQKISVASNGEKTGHRRKPKLKIGIIGTYPMILLLHAIATLKRARNLKKQAVTQGVSLFALNYNL